MLSIIIPSHNAASRTLETARRYLQAASHVGDEVEILIVDDGSRAEERKLLLSEDNDRIRVIETQANLGRGGAVNFGAQASRGEHLLIVDCDCPPALPTFLAEHLRAMAAGADASVGHLQRRCDDFWGHYQDCAVERRERQFANGISYAFTSQNVMINAHWFGRIGGFDTAYTKYGFEDRDFFIRLASAGARIVYTPDAAVIHDDENIRLATISLKMRDAGAFSAPYFAQHHPREYVQLGYAALDARRRPWLRPVGLIVGGAAMTAAPRLDAWLLRMPFTMGRAIASAVTALAYLNGTCSQSTD
jgi:GT2 family glycosyltransferase